jgi:uncharacterized protein (TIGR00369 family)
MGGAELLEKMRLGEIAEPPFARLLGFEMFDSAEGRIVMTLAPQEYHYNPMGCVHGGILSTLLDSVMSAAVQTMLQPGQGYLTMSININFIKPVFEHTGEVMAEGRVVSFRRQVATAEGKIVDVKGEVCATGTAICLISELPGPKKPAPSAAEGPSNG